MALSDILFQYTKKILFVYVFIYLQPEPPKKPSNWRRKHEEFIATIRAAKGLDQALKEGGKLPPPPPPSYDPGIWNIVDRNVHVGRK